MSSTRLARAAVIGGVVEFYDFALFGLASALIFNERFFPHASPLAGTLGALAAFAVGFLARPLGGMVFGHYGDRLGRRRILIVTLLLMGLSTTAIGLLPGYGTIGVLAPLLLVVLRILQGFGAGAEYVGALVLVAESSDAPRRGWWSALPGAAATAGTLLATLVFTAVSALPGFEEWLWRLPFLLSLAGVAVGLYLRSRVRESALFERQRAAGISRFPLLEVVREQPRSLTVAFFAQSGLGPLSYIIQIFVLSHVTRSLGLSPTVALAANVVAMLVAVVATPLFGGLTDRIGRRPVWLAGAAFMTVFAFPMFWLVETGSPLLVVLAVTLGQGVGVASMFGAQGALCAELFHTRHRYSGIAAAREWTAALTSGPAPFVATALAAGAGGRTWPIALLMVGCAAVCFTAVAFAPETRDWDLAEAGPAAGAEPVAAATVM
ncbi:MFS transporter [Actinomadura kijaniata]|uniref:MFS transporter n=1 Tax=Actinomadura kijaniata TaxID=46161 RepID=UPI003F1DAC49